MPTESAPPSEPPIPGPSHHPSSLSIIKCSICGAGGFPSASSRDDTDGIVVLNETVERICVGCARAQETARRADRARDELGGIGLGLGLMGRERDEDVERDDGMVADPSYPLSSPQPLEIPLSSTASSPPAARSYSQSLPIRHTRPWATANSAPPVIAESRSPTPTRVAASEGAERLPNPLLDVASARVPSTGRGALYPGSIFKGTQTSGRSAYEVEVRFLDVNFPASTLSGYLSICHLTDAHPHLTTFFTGEIIGPDNGFITGPRFGATEHDDMRHWGRFEQFRRPSTRADMVSPELYLRDPLPNRNRGETRAKERDFVFLRIKERFLVPDHTVRDISGASFAGFYFAMVDFAPALQSQNDVIPMPSSPITPKLPTTPTSPAVIRRMSSSDAHASSRPDAMRRRRESSAKSGDGREVKGEATMRGYYFHSLNQEPFQELFLTHVPSRSAGTFEMR